jgi:ABC-type uncharacterized transport system permease subunit
MSVNNFSTFFLMTSLLAALIYAVGALWVRRDNETTGLKVLFVGIFFHALSIINSMISEDGQPQFGFAPALSATTWMVLVIYTIEHWKIPQLRVHGGLAALGAFSVILSMSFIGHPLHLQSSPWLPLHLMFGMASYGLFAVAVVHAILLQRAEKKMRLAQDNQTGLPLLTLERLTFRFVKSGFVLLTATLIAGIWFADELYGPAKALKFDHKTVFAILSWVTTGTLLLGRSKLGWRGTLASRMLYIGAALLLLSYVGSRFVLEVILARSL